MVVYGSLIIPPPGETGRSHNVFFSACQSVHSFYITRRVNTIFWKRMNKFWCKWAQAVRRARAWNSKLWGQEVKGQGHMRLKLNWKYGWDIILNPLGSSSLEISSFGFVGVQFCMSLMHITWTALAYISIYDTLQTSISPPSMVASFAHLYTDHSLFHGPAPPLVTEVFYCCRTASVEQFAGHSSTDYQLWTV